MSIGLHPGKRAEGVKMLQLRDITKDYKTNSHTVKALKGINLQFPEREFVAILGPSGCGKTTLLNIIGGLDQYTSGDLIINGRSTKEYKDKDWDQYRNHSIGFVFQSYNLIPHQTVLQNVLLALKISDIDKEESIRKATEALESVGLGDELYKKPNQISGGQSQRVAIARALVTNPDIILADEPTGALDSESSVQVMDILQKISKDKLVIMVTHNEETANKYAERIVRIKDGELVSDSKAYEAENVETQAMKARKAKMRWATSFKLSLNNLWSKKGRTILTAFAGSIGIIGIALIFALSNGIQTYIDRIQEDTLAAYPITIEKETYDANALMQNLMQRNEPEEEERDLTQVYSLNVMEGFLKGMSQRSTVSNNLDAFSTFLENNEEMQNYASTIHYSYGIDLPIYTRAKDESVNAVNISEVMSSAFETDNYQNQLLSQFTLVGQIELFEEMVSEVGGTGISQMYKEQYELLEGKWPEKHDEILLVLDDKNQIPDMTLYALGLRDKNELSDILSDVVKGDAVQTEKKDAERYSFEELMNLNLKLIMPYELYSKNSTTKEWVDLSETDTGRSYLFETDELGLPLHIVGIIRENPEASTHVLEGSFAYTKALSDYVLEQNNKSDIVQEQLNAPETDVFTQLPFLTADWQEPDAKTKAKDFQSYSAKQDDKQKAAYYTWIKTEPSNEELEKLLDQQMESVDRVEIESNLSAQYAREMQMDEADLKSYIASMSDDELFDAVEEIMREEIRQQYRQNAMQALVEVTEEQRVQAFGAESFNEEQWNKLYDEFMPPTVSEASYDDNIQSLQYKNPAEPERIMIYSKSFKAKDNISELITTYNNSAEEDNKIQYVDYIALLMSSITLIISGITYVLVAFVGISLVVSSVMIGIITYVSVLERTKEIGILRALGASKRDVANVFNAETVLEGLAAGLLGIGLTLLLLIPINKIVQHLTKIEDLSAALPWQIGLGLIIISTILTLIAGFIPARMASKMHPVEALRTE